MMKLRYNFDSIDSNGRVNGTVCWSFDERYYYYTNKGADGVFVLKCRTGETHQITGTCQFSVWGLTKGAARAKIRRFMEEK